MPIVTFHLAHAAADDAQCARLMEQASAAYAQILESPIDRVRVFINRYPAATLAIGGNALAAADAGAPYFEYLVLKGRPLEQRQALMQRFTELLSALLGIESGRIRGRCIQLDPEDWGIGGVPASELRQQEIVRRQAERAAD